MTPTAAETSCRSAGKRVESRSRCGNWGRTAAFSVWDGLYSLPPIVPLLAAAPFQIILSWLCYNKAAIFKQRLCTSPWKAETGACSPFYLSGRFAVKGQENRGPLQQWKKGSTYDWVCTREMGSGAFGARYVEPCGLQPMAERPKRRRERRRSRAGRGRAVFGRYTGIGWRPFWRRHDRLCALFHPGLHFAARCQHPGPTGRGLAVVCLTGGGQARNPGLYGINTGKCTGFS